MNLANHAAGIGALADPVRRALYQHIALQRDAVGREAAAEAVGIPVHTAKFHLERLVDEGLLEAEFRRLSGRTGPGSGRPAKLYRRTGREISVSLPARRYDIVGNVLAEAVARAADGEPLADALEGAAHNAGYEQGTEAAACSGANAGARADASTGDAAKISAALDALGFEPHAEDGAIRLANCPFDSLARKHTALVCGLNRDYVQGVAEGLGCAGASAELDPRAGSCCVRVDLAAEPADRS